MPEIEIRDKKNAVTGTLALKDEVFGLRGRGPLLHQAVVAYLANQRQGTHETKTRSEVRGGGRKPYRQKHTGRARAGSIRSPLWKGGGTVFGPHMRDYSQKLPKKARRTALFAALSKKLSEGELLAIEDLNLDAPKTREVVAILKTLGLEKNSVLLVTDGLDEALYRAARNIPRVTVMRAEDLNPYAVLVHERVLAVKAALEKLEVK